MLCPRCGAEMKEGDRFCSSCGSVIEHIEKVEVGKKICPKCGTELVEGVTVCSSCGARISEISMEKASAGARFGSYILDSIIVGVMGFILGFVLEPIASFLGLLISVGYYTYFFGNGQTLGMKAAKIKLCGTDGTYPIGYAKGFLRWIGMIISGLVIGLGYLWILIDENKQGWHDKIAGTYVVVE
ncbi:MAG: RDD family protein [Candidatus Argoarchaeum ethanivorans]|uniref:RDD family protein n=1 Tax=Candidatus Argoarchaeum ethanivorans TaxID=2608793 RepID=A0A811TD39_9EURY|nr:MAG: RDD family protein [Candidatus Argoarchaeum ethanivorans]